MNAFPLSPFLVSLVAEGFHITIHDYQRISLVLKSNGPWDVRRLRGVLLALLVRDPSQEDTFLRLFGDFFRLHLKDEAVFAQIDLNTVLDDLQKLAGLPSKKDERELLPNWQGFAGQTKTYSRRTIRSLAWLSISLVLSIGLISLLLYPPIVTTLNINPDIWKGLVGSNVSQFSGSTLALVFFLNAGLVGWFVWRAIKLSRGEELSWNPYATRHYSLGIVGGKPASQLDPIDLDYIADSMGYFRSEEADKFLDVSASVKASGHNFGFPTLIYRRRRILRTVLILEDAFAEALSWNTIPHELAEGLSQRGIPVLHGKFYSSIAQFKTSDGMVYSLEDLEDERRRYLLLIFSDGKSFHHRDSYILEAVSRWPLLAWMELREPSFWDESTTIPLRYGIPIYCATRDGLLKIVSRYLKEEAPQKDLSEDADDWKGVPPFTGVSLNVYLEYLLGEALPWAQDCALLQPISLGLADALRRQFHPNLPPERVERLLVMPGTTSNIVGIRFSKQVLSVLRSGFKSRRTKKGQEAVLNFIIKKIEETEPEQVDSLAHHKWEWTRERVRLNLEPTIALKRLNELARSPLGDSILEDLKEIIIPEFHESGDIWELENSYRRANDLYKQGGLDNALQVVLEGLKGNLNDEALLTLKERIERTKELQGAAGTVAFFEQKQRSTWKYIPARSTHRVSPEYPLQAKQNSVSGIVVVEVSINEEGDVIRTKILEGPAPLRQAAESAARGWRFDPASSEGISVASTELIVFSFNL